MGLMVQRSVGISITGEHASFVELAKVGGRVRLRGTGTIRLPLGGPPPFAGPPPGTGDSRPDRDDALGTLPERLRKRRPDAVIIGLPRRAIVLRSLDLPSLDDKDLAGLLAFEVERHLPFPPEEACYQFQRQKRNGGKVTVMLAATRRGEGERHLQMVQALGLEPTGVDVSAFAAANALVYHRRPRRGEIVCLIALAAGEVEVSVVRDGVLLSSRVLPLAEDPVEPLLQELRRAQEDGVARPTRVFVEAGTDMLCGRLAEALGVPVEAWSPATPPVDASAYGLALKGLMKLPIQIDLLPPERRPKRRERAVAVMFVLLALLGALAAAFGVGSVYRDRTTLRQLTLRVAEAKAHAAEVDALKAEFLKLRKQQQILDELVQARGRGLGGLRELVSLLPGNVALSEFSLEGTKLQIRGTTGGSASELIAAFERSSYFENAAFTSPISAQGADRQVFQLQAFVKSGERQAAGNEERPAGGRQRAAGSGRSSPARTQP